MYQILFNPKSGNNTGEATAKRLQLIFREEALSFTDVTGIRDVDAFLASLAPDDTVVLVGGDGTLNHFANDISALPEQEVLYYAGGSGNDFLNDLGEDRLLPIPIKPYLKNLPTVTVKGKTYRFLNGIGYGIDGYCCEMGDKEREKNSTKPINYTSIAIKGLLFHYKPTNATVTVDGVTGHYKKVWLAPTMNGKCYGGGMFPTPDQDRLHNETVSTMVFYGAGKLRTLMAFPSIFKGEHVKYTQMVKMFRGKHVVVEFDRPTALQIDGETVLGVTRYEVHAAVQEKESQQGSAEVLV